MEDNFDIRNFIYNNPLLENEDLVGLKEFLNENQDNKAYKWDNLLEDEMKWELLLTAIKDPKEAEKYIEFKYNELPPEVTQNINWSIEHEGQETDDLMESKLRSIIEKTLEEMSVTGGGTAGASFTAGTGEQYATPFAFNKNKKAKGTSRDYSKKLGYKTVNRKDQAKHSKAIDYKDLWGSTYKD